MLINANAFNIHSDSDFKNAYKQLSDKADSFYAPESAISRFSAFELIPSTDGCELIQEGSEIFFMDGGGKEIKVESIVREKYKCNDSAGNINPTSTIHVFSVKSSWHILYGGVQGNLTLMGAADETLYNWNVISVSGNVYVADADSTITWTELYALGKMTNGSNGTADFADADLALGLTTAADNISVTYTDDNGNTPRNTSTFNVFKETVGYVPVDESTNNTNFYTGILWDAHDSTDNEYNATEKEDLVFAVEINENAQGKYGVCDYEIKVPYLLQEYKDSTNMLYFYLELR